MNKLQIDQAELCRIAENVLTSGRTFSFRAYGSSMSPFIRDGDTVYLEQFPSYGVGDVVLVRGAGVQLHRIVQIDAAGVTTRGDGMLQADPGPIGLDGVLGRAVKISGGGCNFHLRPPFSRMLAHPRFADHILRNRLVRQLGRLLLPLLR